MALPASSKYGKLQEQKALSGGLEPIRNDEIFWINSNPYCHLVGNFFSTALALIGCFEVSWHLTMKLFPTKISDRGTMQNLWRQKVTVHCSPRTLTAREIYFHKFVHEKVFLCGLYNKLLEDWSLGKQLILFPSNLDVSFGSASRNNIHLMSDPEGNS